MTPADDGPLRQTRETEVRNSEFFLDNDRYVQSVSELETYANIRHALSSVIGGSQRLLDVGNGGVFDYDTATVGQIVAVDLFLDEATSASLPSNVESRQGNVLALDDDLVGFDTVLFVMLLHHLTGERASDTESLIREAMAQARRALGPGGRLVVVESCTPSWFVALERVLFPVVKQASDRRLIKHPPTFQLSAGRITDLLLEQFRIDRCEPIPCGRYVLQFGRRWPTRLTPARPYLFVAVPR
jgi:SAM-dependent methyltransferase